MAGEVRMKVMAAAGEESGWVTLPAEVAPFVTAFAAMRPGSIRCHDLAPGDYCARPTRGEEAFAATTGLPQDIVHMLFCSFEEALDRGLAEREAAAEEGKN